MGRTIPSARVPIRAVSLLDGNACQPGAAESKCPHSSLITKRETTMYKNLLFSALSGILIASPSSQLAGEEPTVAYADDFSSVKGFHVTNSNGEIEEPNLETATRQIFTFMSDETSGNLSIRLLEDKDTAGPDGKPGVLSMAYLRVPNSALFSGFVYDGRRGDPIKLANFKGEVGQTQLSQVKVSFRYKATNPDSSKVGASYNCRFELAAEDPYEYRIDFGTLRATADWQTFERTLSSGTNHYMFLRAVNQSPDVPFRLVWGQEGEVSSYDDGDTLLVDDVKITIEN